MSIFQQLIFDAIARKDWSDVLEIVKGAKK